MKNSFLASLLILLAFAQPAYAKNMSSKKASSEEQVDKHLEKLIGTMIRSRLAKFHYTQKSLDDALSKKAFPEFLKRFDYNKQYFLKSDVKKLEKYRFLMDDQMTSAKHEYKQHQ
jgi:carboxyl-terminal processing protease